jgi:hypothetical protein
MCKQCGSVKNIPDGTDIHTQTWCTCCDKDHHHGELAAQCTPDQNHPGELCWNPPGQPLRPDNCGVCRPVMVLPVAGPLSPGGLIVAGGVN